MHIFIKVVGDSNTCPRVIVLWTLGNCPYPFTGFSWALIIPYFPLEGIFVCLVWILRIFVLVVCSLCCWFPFDLALFFLVELETMASTPMDTNQETPMQGDLCDFPSTGMVVFC